VDGSQRQPDGSVRLPNGRVLTAEAAQDKLPADAVLEDGVCARLHDGTLILPTGARTLPDGNLLYPDGSVRVRHRFPSVVLLFF
jgi:hypothetical protein